MTFIDFNGRKINLNQVREIQPCWSKDRNRRGALLIYADGKTEMIQDQSAYDSTVVLEEQAAPVIRAEPGFYLLSFWFHDGEPNVDEILKPTNRDPIVAWRVDAYGPNAVAVDDQATSNLDYHKKAILRPDGVVVEQASETWKDINSWAEDVCNQWRQWLEKKKTEVA